MEELRLIDLEKRYDGAGGEGFALQPVALAVKEGEFFSLLGPSGCGKTTLLKLAAGLMEPDSGEVWAGGKNITRTPAEAREFAMVFQQPLLFPHMTVAENVAFGLKMQRVGKKERFRLAEDMLGHVGLEGFAKRFPEELSGGQQQRVALARALVTDPQVLLMDEPFSALDPALREEMRELLSRIQKEFRVTVLFVTHDLEEAFSLSDRVGVMAAGELLQTGNPRQLYEQPVSARVASFLGLKNQIAGEIKDGRFSSADGSIRVAVGGTAEEGPCFLIVRPEVLQPATEGEVPADALRFSGTVREVKFSHGYYTGKVEAGPALLHCRFASRQAERLAAGDPIELWMRPQDAWFVRE